MIESPHASRRRLRVECLEDRCLLSAAGEFYQPPQVHLRDVDGFLSGPSTAGPLEIAIDYARSHADALGLSTGDLDDFVVADRYVTGHNGVTHLYLRQTYRGLEVLGADLSVNVSADGRVINTAASFVPGLDDTAKAVAGQPGLTAVEALIAWAEDSGLIPDATSWTKGSVPAVLSTLDDLPQTTVLAGGGISSEDIPAELHYVPTPDGGVELAWRLNIQTTDGRHWYDASVSATDGELLFSNDWAHGVADEQYNVFAMPSAGPQDGPRSLATLPADPVASPFGWHDIDGVAGAEFQITVGNNVSAQEDRDDDNSSGLHPDGGVDLNFDFPLDLDGSPIVSQSASITNLFYWNNVLHDVHYQYGFDEVAGNFQHNNYGRGGTAGDAVRADAQDGSGINNANFATPPDGEPPRMQMFLWEPAIGDLTIDSPEGIADVYAATTAVFGPTLDPVGVTGQFVLAEPLLAGQPLTNANEIAGNIAVIDRGDFFFVIKVKHAQDAGAIGVLIVNNVPGDPVLMGGEDETITIPALMIDQATGTRIKVAIESGPVSGKLSLPARHDRDSSLDNQIIIHEYGHGVSTRLTGGPGNVGGLEGVQSGGMGEGWADWWGLMLTQTAEDDRMDAQRFAQYVKFGLGLRRFPYSFDMDVNELTYKNIADDPEVHAVGEIWASALWDLNWLLIEGDGGAMPALGFDSDFYHGTGGNNLALQLIIDGLKLQPSNPTMLDARDAILLADTNNNGGANHRAIWTAFARRGMGLSANDGGDHNSTDVVEAFDMPLMPAIAGRHIFYNNSAFDATSDDQAVATDKTALLPGQAAMAANYTSYSRGLNGIMVDVADLPPAGPAIVAGDYFQFHVGNDGPDGWVGAPDPISATLRTGEGNGASDRITLIWEDNAIEQQWLRVTVLANANTGLDEPDVFYFGNAIAESGDRAVNTIVNATDEIVARNFQHGAVDPAAIDDPFDYDRDGLVDGTDQIIARSHQTNPLTMLRLIAAPAIAAGAVDGVLEQVAAETLASQIDWLYELEQSRAKRRPVATSASAEMAEMAVDLLLRAR
ncbi:MAG: M36 family metallopeptidase [Thermoguttaceae bacterium]